MKIPEHSPSTLCTANLSLQAHREYRAIYRACTHTEMGETSRAGWLVFWLISWLVDWLVGWILNRIIFVLLRNLSVKYTNRKCINPYEKKVTNTRHLSVALNRPPNFLEP